MNYNTDGFNDRNIYIRNSNDKNRLRENGPSNLDGSFAKMRVEENKPDVKTVNRDKSETNYEVRGNRENFVIMNNNMRNANVKTNSNNPVSNALNRNMFKKF